MTSGCLDTRPNPSQQTPTRHWGNPWSHTSGNPRKFIFLRYTRDISTIYTCCSYLRDISEISLRYEKRKIYLRYLRYIPGLSNWYIPEIYLRYLSRFPSTYPRYISELYLRYSILFEIQQSALQQNRGWNVAEHRFWIARVFNVHHSSWRPHRAHVGPGRRRRPRGQR